MQTCIYYIPFLVPGSSKHRKEAEVNIRSGNASKNTYNRPKLKQTPSIVINSPSSCEKRVIDVDDVTLNESGTEGNMETNVRSFVSEREPVELSYFEREGARKMGGSVNTYLNKEMPLDLQPRAKESPVQLADNREKEPYLRFPYEKQVGDVFEYEMYANEGIIDNVENGSRKLSREMNLPDSKYHEFHGEGNCKDAEARNVSPGTRIVSPGTRNEDIGLRNDQETGMLRAGSSDKIRTSPRIFSERIENPEGFQRPRPTYMSQDATYENRLQSQRNYYPGTSSVANQPTPRQISRQSQSESNLKSKSPSERPMYSVVKTLSHPTSIQDGRLGKESRNSEFLSEANLISCNALGVERRNSDDAEGIDRNEKHSRPKSSPLLRRLASNRREPVRDEDEKSDTSPLVNREPDLGRKKFERKNPGSFQTDQSRKPSGVSDTPIGKGKQPESKNIKKNSVSDGDIPVKESVSSTSSGRTNDMFKDDLTADEKSQSEFFGGLLGESDGNHSAEYYDRMISKINEQINLAVSRNKSPYAVYGLGSDDDDDWC